MTLDQMEELLIGLEDKYKKVEEERRFLRRAAESSPAALAARKGHHGSGRAKAAESVALKTDKPYRDKRNESHRLKRRLDKFRREVEEERAREGRKNREVSS